MTPFWRASSSQWKATAARPPRPPIRKVSRWSFWLSRKGTRFSSRRARIWSRRHLTPALYPRAAPPSASIPARVAAFRLTSNDIGGYRSRRRAGEQVSHTLDSKSDRYDQISYDQISSAYDLIAEPAEHEVRARGLALLDAQLRERVLDVGAGTGGALPALAALVGEAGLVCGLDAS